MEKKIDKRTIKTKRAIKQAFIDLLLKKNLNDITITDISKQADINRKTFYNNYKGIHEIVNDIEEELFLQFKAAIKGLDVNKEMQNPYNLLIRLTNLLDSDYQFYSKIMSSELRTHLQTKIVTYVKERVKTVLKSNSNYSEYELNVVTDYSVTGMLSVYNKWMESGRTEPIDKIALIISDLFFFGVEKHRLPEIR